jgi:hypothetical protein
MYVFLKVIFITLICMNSTDLCLGNTLYLTSLAYAGISHCVG